MNKGTVGIVVRTALALSAVVFCSSTQVAAGAVRVPSRYVPGDDAVSAAFRDQSDVFVVDGGGTILALWGDDRANWLSSYTVSETSWDIYGMRFDAAGNQLETVPFPIVTGPASQTRPRAAWNGTHWLVVFESVDWGGTGYYADSLEALRVDTDGNVIDSKPIKIFNMTPVGTWDVASDGSGWVVVNQGTSVTGDIVAARISAAGVLLDPGPRSLVPETYYMRGPFELAYAGGVFLLAYEEAGTGSDPTNAIRFDANLDLLDAAPFPLAPARLKRMASNGSQFYAVWHDRLPDYTYAVFGQRIDTDGQLLDGAGVNISGSDTVLDYYGTSVVWDGSQWKVTWGTTAGTRLARVTTAGQVLDPNGVPVAGTKSGISASPGDGSLRLGWKESQSSNNGSDVFSSRVDAANVAGPTTTLSVGAPSQLRADIAAGDSGYMMVYWSRNATTSRILAQPLDAAGNPLTAEPTELEATVSFYYPGPPAVAWNGSSYMVAWNNADGVVARRVQPDGTPIDAAPIVVLDPGFGTVDVEALGDNFLVVGLRCGTSCEYVSPIAARVRGSDGVVLDSTPIVMGGIFSSDPRLTVLGDRWFLVWRVNITHDECGASTRGTFIDANGVKVPDFYIQGYSSCGGNGIFHIGVAASDNMALVVQSAELTSGVETDLAARRVDASGTVYPLINLTPWKDDQYHPRVAWDGSQFVVVYQDQRTNLFDPLWGTTLEPIDARSDLMGMRVTEDGVVLDPLGFVISNATTAEAYPNVVASGGTTLVAASIMRNDSTHANYRIGYEFYGEGGNSWPVATASSNPTGGDVPLSVDFSSAGSSDPDGTLTAWAWDFGDGATSMESDPTHLYTAGGPYIATLTVTDDGGTTSMQEVQVMALEPNVPPVAVISSDTTSGPVPLEVVFSATGSYDPDGVIGNIEWQFSDGGSYWGSPAWYTFYSTGTYQATLIVHDGRGGTGSTSMEITVGGPDPPTAPSGLSAIAFTDEWINLTWDDNSNNEDGFKVERCSAPIMFCNANPNAWVEIAQTGPNIDYHGDTGLPYSTTFHYRVRAFNVTAESAYSNTATATTKGAYPTAVITPSVLAGPAPLTVEFDGTGSYDPDSTIVQWSWSFGDGYSAMGPTATHTYNWPGWYWVTLHVWSDDGPQGDATVLIKALDDAPTSTCGEAASTTPMLTLSKTGGDSVELQWGASCVPSDNDYGVYAGPIGDFTAHVPVVCSTGGAASTTVVPPEGDVYYLVVPNNEYLEGMYGSDSSGAEIQAGPTRCYPPATGRECAGDR